MLRVKQLGLLFLVAVLWASLGGVAGAQQTVTSSFFEAECNISHKTQLSCPKDFEFLPGTKCYSCSIGDGKPGDCLAYCNGEYGGSCHCEAEEVCPAGSAVSGGGCELHSSGDSVAQLTETSPSASGWECSWRHEEGSLIVDAYVSCVGLGTAN
jgi:hypothetical protein